MFGVFTSTLTHVDLPKLFSRGYGGVQNNSGNSGGVRELFQWSKNGNSGEEEVGGGGGLHEIFSMVGVWIFSGSWTL